MHILYKPDPELYIADLFSHNHHTENKDQNITGLKINIHTIGTSINKRQSDFFANIMHVLGGVLPEQYPKHP